MSLIIQEEPTNVQLFTNQVSEIQQQEELLDSYNLVVHEKGEVDTIPVIEFRLRFPYLGGDIPQSIKELISFARTWLSISYDY